MENGLFLSLQQEHVGRENQMKTRFSPKPEYFFIDTHPSSFKVIFKVEVITEGHVKCETCNFKRLIARALFRAAGLLQMRFKVPLPFLTYLKYHHRFLYTNKSFGALTSRLYSGLSRVGCLHYPEPAIFSSASEYQGKCTTSKETVDKQAVHRQRGSKVNLFFNTEKNYQHHILTQKELAAFPHPPIALSMWKVERSVDLKKMNREGKQSFK